MKPLFSQGFPQVFLWFDPSTILFQVVKLLLAQLADPNAVDLSGTTCNRLRHGAGQVAMTPWQICHEKNGDLELSFEVIL